MTPAHRILWGEGTFLQPQHFQQQDLYLENRFAQCLTVARTQPWGIGRVEVDRQALERGFIHLESLEMVFQDGTFYQAPAVEPLPPGRLLSDIQPSGSEVLVFACLPFLDAFGGNTQAGPEEPARSARFRTARTQASDLFTDALESELAVLHANVKLLLEGENRDGQLSVPLLRLRRDETGAWAQDETYLPPLLEWGASRTLTSLARRILDILQVKSGALRDVHRERSRQVAEFGTADIASFWLLHTVNRNHPALRHLLAHPRTHPEELYKVLAQLAGELTTFSSTSGLEEIPAYRHEDLTSTFLPLGSLVRTLLETVISARYAAIPLQESRPSFHLGRLESDRLAGDCDFYLSVCGDRPAGEILQAVPLKVKAGSPDDVEKILHSALPGIHLRHVVQTPPGLPVRLGNQYFALDPQGPIYERMLKARCICLYVPQTLPPMKLELLAVFR